MSGVLGHPEPERDERATAAHEHRAGASERAGQRGWVRVRGHGGTATVSVVDRDGHALTSGDWYQRYGT